MISPTALQLFIVLGMFFSAAIGMYILRSKPPKKPRSNPPRIRFEPWPDGRIGIQCVQEFLDDRLHSYIWFKDGKAIHRYKVPR